MQELQLDDECETMIRADGSWDFGENETPAPGVKIDLLRHNFSMAHKKTVLVRLPIARSISPLVACRLLMENFYQQRRYVCSK